jgi:CheY-like chemotaxis protein
MDHMMPNMDGMETTRILRDLGYTRPIVALTANAVMGQAALFLANGFDRFISKPIDLRQLNVVLNSLIRDTQAPEVIAAARRQAAGSAPADTGDHAGRPQLDQELAASFVRDAEKAVAVLEAAYGQEASGGGENSSLYTITAHALKSALANIGEEGLSNSALRLEQAGREQDFAVISAETPKFLDALRVLIAQVTPKDEDEHCEIQDEDPAHLREKLFVLQAMCTAYDIGAAVNVLTELRQKTWSRKTRELLNAVTEHLLHSDLDEAADMAKDYVESMRAE